MGLRRSIPRRKDFWALKRNQCPLVALAGDFTGMRLQGLNYGVKQVVKKQQQRVWQLTGINGLGTESVQWRTPPLSLL